MLVEFIAIMRDIILPVFVIMVIGFILQRKLTLDVQTLARLIIYYVVPAFIFVRLYEAEIQWSIFANIVLFILLLEIGRASCRDRVYVLVMVVSFVGVSRRVV